MHKRWRKRLKWGAVLGLVFSSYSASAWLWAAPNRPALVAAQPPLRVSAVPAPNIEALPPVPEPARVAAEQPVVASPARTPPLQNTRNFLVIGLDRRADGTGPALADSLFVVVLDESSKHIGLVSIPRDLLVDIPDGPSDRINTVYQLARRTKRDPLALMSRVVEDTLRLPIEHALALDLGVFERAVDAVGGVDVDVPCPIRDNFVDLRVEGGRRPLDLDAGRQHLDGVTAAMYARSRHGRSDFSRTRRQQAVLLGVQHALSGFGLLQLPDLWSAFETSIETDLRRYELLALGKRAAGVDPTHLHGLVLGHEHVQGHRTEEGKSVLLPNFDAIDASLAKLFSAPSPGTRPVHSVCEPKDVALKDSGA